MTPVGLLKSGLAVSLPAVLRQRGRESEGKQLQRNITELLSWSLSEAAVEHTDAIR